MTGVCQAALGSERAIFSPPPSVNYYYYFVHALSRGVEAQTGAAVRKVQV